MSSRSDQPARPLLAERLGLIWPPRGGAPDAADDAAALLERVAPPETWFFRYPASFEHLRAHLSRLPRGPVRMASLGCATGAEAASMSIASLAAGVDATVVGLDANPEAVARGREGVWSAMSLRPPLPAWAEGYLVRSGQEVRVKPEVTARMTLRSGNLLDPELAEELGEGTFHAVFCRNVVIYLRPDARQRLGGLLRRILQPGGILYLGHAEPPSIVGLAGDVEPSAFAWSAVEPARHAAGRRDARSGGARAAEAPQRQAGGAAKSERPARSAAAPAPSATSSATSSASPTASPTATPDELDRVQRLADAGTLEEALRAGEALFRAGVHDVRLLHLLGAVESARGHPEKAREWMRRATYADPSHPEANLHLAAAAESEGRHREAARRRAKARRGDAP